MTPLDAVEWALVFLGAYIGVLAVKAVIYGNREYKSMLTVDKLIYRYGQLYIAAAVCFTVGLMAAMVTKAIRGVLP